MGKYISRVLYILGESKQNLPFLLVVFAVSSLLEVVGIGFVGPFLWIASNPGSIRNTPLLNWLYELMPIQSERWFIVLLGLLLIAVFCVKAALYFLSQAHINKFGLEQQKKVALKLLTSYLSAPYTFYLNRDTASLIQNIILESRNFCHQCILPLMTVFSNGVTAIFLIVLLAWTNLLFLVMIAVVILPAILLLYKFKETSSRWGKESADSYHEIIRIINHSLGGVKETYVIGCQPYFLEQMNIQASRNATVVIKFFNLRVVPRLVLETSLIVALVVLVIVHQVFSSQSSSDLLATLSVFAVASIRLIPVFNSTATSISEMQNASYVVDMLYADLRDLERQFKDSRLEQGQRLLAGARPYKAESLVDASNFSSFSKIEVANVSYRYPGSEKIALEDISFNIKRGDSIALIGKSGAGKTTLADAILGLLEVDDGDILVDGESIYKDLRSWQNMVGYIPQSIFLIDDTIERNIAFGVPDHLIDAEKLQRSIHAAQLADLIEHLPQGIKTPVGERGVRISGGQRQRVGIARALYHDREILVLDEATAALDHETESLISEAIQSLSGNKTLIIIAHRLSTVKECDQIYLLQEGQIAKAGRYDEVVSNPIAH